MKFADKHAPRSFDDLVIEKDNIRSRLKQYADGDRLKHLLIYGPTGTGKSAAARIILETRCGIDCAEFTPPFEGSKFTAADLDLIMTHWNWQFINGAKIAVTVVNEVDLLSLSLREKLKSLMDEKGHMGQVIATTNNLHSLSAPMQRRFDKIELPALTVDGCLERAQQILNLEGIEMSDDDLRDHFEDFEGELDDMVSIVEDIVLEAVEV
jgi:DNA polymerase III delta prime subunit